MKERLWENPIATYLLLIALFASSISASEQIDLSLSQIKPNNIDEAVRIIVKVSIQFNLAAKGKYQIILVLTNGNMN